MRYYCHLIFIINCLLCKGIYPDCLKLMKVTPIFKKGVKEDPGNYRPIAIVPIISKIIESCLLKQLYDYFVTNKLLDDQQFGSRPKMSTTMAVECIVDYILKCFEDRLVAGTSGVYRKIFRGVPDLLGGMEYPQHRGV